jgi:dephospho-CoA kinase
MYLIALTGGIASGKSLVASRLAELGAVHIDADQLAREVVEPGTPALEQIITEFGENVISADGSLDRQALANIVFTDPAKRGALNAITHPAVWRRVLELCEEAEAADPSAIVVYDVPLLVEASSDRHLTFDLIVVVDAPAEARLDRLVRDRGMARQEASHRINSQATDAERLAIADVIIDNTGSIEATLEQVNSLWASVVVRNAGDTL